MKNLQNITLGIWIISGVEYLFDKNPNVYKESTHLEKGFYRRVSLLDFLCGEKYGTIK